MSIGNSKISLIKTLKRTYELVGEYSKQYVVLTAVIMLFQGVLPAIIILVMRETINLLQSGAAEFSEIIKLLFAYLVLNIMNASVLSIYNYYKGKFSLEFSKFLNLKMLNKAEKLKLKDFENEETYNIINRAQEQNGSSLIGYLSDSLSVLKEMITIVSMTIIIISFRWWVVITILVIPVFNCVVMISIDKSWYDLRMKRTKDEREKWYICFLMMMGTAFKEIKVLGISKYLIGKYEKITDKIIAQDLKVQKKMVLWSCGTEVLDYIMTGLVYMFIFFEGFIGKILIGDVTAYINSIEKIKSSTQGIFLGIENIIEQSLYVDLLYQYLDLPIELNEEKIKVKKVDKIEFRNVSFKYNYSEYVLTEINLTLDNDSKIALIGENGSGKTTLIKLIMGLYDDYDGVILVNDIDLRKIDIEDYRRKIGCVFQDYIKYEMSLRENIAFGAMERFSDDDFIWEQVKTVDLDNRICRSGGLEQVLGKWFGNQEFSIGEWQRIAIARALIKNADVYIFDEPDASLDVLKQKEMIKTYKKISNGKIFIYISHKVVQAHMLAKTIYVLENGKIVEQGSHHQLMEKSGKYFRLFNEHAKSSQ